MYIIFNLYFTARGAICQVTEDGEIAGDDEKSCKMKFFASQLG